MIPTRQADTLRRVLESERIDLHTALPGVVRSYDADTQTAEIELGACRVLPAVDEDAEEDTTEPYPILPSVPVVFPTGGGYAITWPLERGDGVLVVFSESDLSRWRETGQAGEDPGVPTRHGLSGAIAIPGLHWRGAASSEAATASLRLGKVGGPRIDISGSTIEAGGTAALAKSGPTGSILDAVSADLTTLQAAINAIVSGAVPTLTTATAIGANPIATTTLKGA